AGPDEPRLLRALALELLPLVEAVGGDNAALALERTLERVARQQLVGARVDHSVADLRVLGPERHEPPAHDIEDPLTVALRDDRHLRAGGDVVVGLELLRPHLGHVEALGQQGRRRDLDVAAAHDGDGTGNPAANCPSANLLTTGRGWPKIKP